MGDAQLLSLYYNNSKYILYGEHDYMKGKLGAQMESTSYLNVTT